MAPGPAGGKGGEERSYGEGLVWTELKTQQQELSLYSGVESIFGPPGVYFFLIYFLPHI